MNEDVRNMKFDVIVNNPPYHGRALLHQKVFNKSVELLKETGILTIIQPATPYHNKKNKKKAAESQMIEYIKKYHTNVKLVPSTVFNNAQVATDLAITTISKIPSNGNIESVTYKNGITYNNVPLEDISMTEIPPDVYKSIRDKYYSYIKKNGSLYDITVSSKESMKGASIAGIRGNMGKNDFYTMVSKNDLTTSVINDKGQTVKCQLDQVKNVHTYLMTDFARFGLSLLKFAIDNRNGELKSVPLVDFNKVWTDDELFNMIGITDDERKEIEKVIPEWDHYGIK